VAAALVSDIKDIAFKGDTDASGAASRDQDAKPSDAHWLGLHSDLACLCELAAAKALLQGEALRLAVVDVGAQLRSFFSWLYLVWNQLEGTNKV
jgi:hypothetical protein